MQQKALEKFILNHSSLYFRHSSITAYQLCVQLFMLQNFIFQSHVFSFSTHTIHLLCIYLERNKSSSTPHLSHSFLKRFVYVSPPWGHRFWQVKGLIHTFVIEQKLCREIIKNGKLLHNMKKKWYFIVHY